ncbi:MAG: flagellar export protein FliJ [Hyphomicrobiaceae bacterium]
MKSRDTAIRARQFELADKRRKLADMETMISDFRRMASDLDQQIEAEHARTGIRDVHHFAYPPFAKAARQRRDNLLASVEDLIVRLESARQDLAAAEDEVKRIAETGEKSEERAKFSRRPVSRGRSGASRLARI